MRIASVDPGVETGLALATVFLPIKEARLRQYFLGTYTLSGNIIEMIQYSKVDHVIVERRPALIAGPGINIYTTVLEKLKDLGYKPSSAALSNWDDKQVILIGPGEWKPVTGGALGKKLVQTWGPRNDHEKDAMMMLLYYMKIKFPDRSVSYV